MESKPQKKSRATTQRRNKQTVCVSGLWRELPGGTAVEECGRTELPLGKVLQKVPSAGWYCSHQPSIDIILFENIQAKC